MKYLIYSILIAVVAISCKETFSPKPRGYFRIDFPAKEYQLFDSTCPYSFEYPKYAKIEANTSKTAEPCWIDISFPHYKCKIYLSYKSLNQNLSQVTEDSHELAYKHTIKADAIDEYLVNDPSRKVYGIVYDISGNAASSVQFHLTDSLRHFLRGSLYFETRPNKDSLAPAIAFFRKDIDKLISTLKWK